MTTAKTIRTAQRIAGECLARRARLVSRAVSGLYEEALRPHGITTAQMGILTAVTARGEPRPRDVTTDLCLEKSSLSRNLDRMIDHGWLEVVPGDDARSQRLRVTAKGGSAAGEDRTGMAIGSAEGPDPSGRARHRGLAPPGRQAHRQEPPLIRRRLAFFLVFLSFP